MSDQTLSSRPPCRWTGHSDRGGRGQLNLAFGSSKRERRSGRLSVRGELGDRPKQGLLGIVADGVGSDSARSLVAQMTEPEAAGVDQVNPGLRSAAPRRTLAPSSSRMQTRQRPSFSPLIFGDDQKSA